MSHRFPCGRTHPSRGCFLDNRFGERAARIPEWRSVGPPSAKVLASSDAAGHLRHRFPGHAAAVAVLCRRVHGPFGTVIIVPMFPELREGFDTSSTVANLGFSLYLIPFAALLLVSGTLGERWGRRRTVRGTYLLYAAASLACALAPTIEIFIAARAVQGVANAFITPLLLAGLAETVAPERFGRQVGIYSSFQAARWRAGPGHRRPRRRHRLAVCVRWNDARLAAAGDISPRWRCTIRCRGPALSTAHDPADDWLGVAFFFAAAGPIGINVLVGVIARDVLDLSGSVTGIVLFAGGVERVVPGSAVGAGPRPVRYPYGWVDDVGSCHRLGGASLTRRRGVVARAALGCDECCRQRSGGCVPSARCIDHAENRGGALSFLLSFRFVGTPLDQSCLCR